MIPKDHGDWLRALLTDTEVLYIQTLLIAGRQGGASTSGRAAMLEDQADSLQVSIDVLGARVAHIGTVTPSTSSAVSAPGSALGSTLSALLDANRQYLRRVEVLLECWPSEDVATMSVLFAIETETARRVGFLLESTRHTLDSPSAHEPPLLLH
ncbi:hypothetical protein [Deinococcus rufus]|uniref:DUF2383 domain-containing protein n=1 Tax=Deinococcus rufus TaxID=2136097 RepID=A0ABV7Z7M8_9DEIO